MITLLTTLPAASAGPAAKTAGDAATATAAATSASAANAGGKPQEPFAAVLQAYAATLGRLAGEATAAGETGEAAAPAEGTARPAHRRKPADDRQPPAADAAAVPAPFLPITAARIAGQAAGTETSRAGPGAQAVHMPHGPTGNPAPGAEHPATAKEGSAAAMPETAAAAMPDVGAKAGSSPETAMALRARADPIPSASGTAGAPPAALAIVQAPAIAAPPPVPLALPVAAPVGSRAFAPEAASQVAFAVRGGVERASLTVSPPELGPVHVRIELADGKAQVHFSADAPAAREALAEALPRLRESLAGHGIALSGGSIGADGSRRDAQEAPRQPGSEPRGNARPDAVPEPDSTAAALVRVRVPGLVDEFA